MEKLTQLQWLKKGYILKPDAQGTTDWNNGYCTFLVTRYNENEVLFDQEKAKQILKEKRHQQYVQRKEEQRLQEIEIDAYLQRVEELRQVWHTKYQWEQLNKKVKDGARGKLGEDLNKENRLNCCFGTSYRYYHIEDTEEIE